YKTSNFHAVFSDHTVRIQKHHCSQPGCGWHSTPTITSLFGTNIHPDLATIQLSLSRLNHWWPEWEVSPAMMEGAAADHRRVQRGLKGGNEARQLVHGHAGDLQKCGRVGLPARARSTSHCGGLLASEA